ncbi:DNA polymerase III subunit gamma and tau [Thermocatellispora tengchongensis]|uniref:DNA polymerase III subunit gamma and tau n=1 Tax=Thermocatellispora tengchongensis TaxID=1073253 RepID=UPI003631AFB0
MSLALYRKYRPGTFAEVKGQEHVTEPLRQALRSGRINHAYLFSGPRGCGKTSSARILARSLNCEKGPTPDPCGECESCVALAATGPGHLDVIEIDAASHGGVDDARDLRERAFFAPVSARYKIYIIDEAHMVTREGFNALLKLVEEPPPHLKFVFATTEPEKVIGTIKSRTHHYPFRLMPPATLRALLEEILNSENVPFEPAALPLVVRAGAGSARDSLSILDQLLAGADESGITYARAVSLLGYTDGDLLDEVINAFAARDGAQVFQAVNRVIEGGHDPRRFAMDLLERFRDLVILANVPEAAASGLLDRPADELERLQAQAASMGPAELTRAAEVFNAGLTEMRGATSPRLLLELMCARVLLPGAAQGEAALLARIERLERGGAGGAGGGAGFAGGGAVPLVGAPAGASAPAAGPAAPAAAPAAPVAAAPAAPAAPVAAPTPAASAPAAASTPAAPARASAADDDWPAPVRPGQGAATPPSTPAPQAAPQSAPAPQGGGGAGGSSRRGRRCWGRSSSAASWSGPTSTPTPRSWASRATSSRSGSPRWARCGTSWAAARTPWWPRRSATCWAGSGGSRRSWGPARPAAGRRAGRAVALRRVRAGPRAARPVGERRDRSRPHRVRGRGRERAASGRQRSRGRGGARTGATGVRRPGGHRRVLARSAATRRPGGTADERAQCRSGRGAVGRRGLAGARGGAGLGRRERHRGRRLAGRGARPHTVGGRGGRGRSAQRRRRRRGRADRHGADPA